MHEVNIFIHILAGTVGTIIGFIPFFTIKGGKWHRRSGHWFLSLLAIIVITAFNGVLFFRDRPFLTVITVMAMYSGISGYRALQYKAKGPGWIDLMVVVGVAIVAISFLFKIQSANIVWSMKILYYTFSFLALYLSYDLLRIFKVIKSSRLWLLEHILKTTGAFGAVFGTAVATIFYNWAPYNQFVGFGISYILWIFGFIYYFRTGKQKLDNYPVKI